MDDERPPPPTSAVPSRAARAVRPAARGGRPRPLRSRRTAPLAQRPAACPCAGRAAPAVGRHRRRHLRRGRRCAPHQGVRFGHRRAGAAPCLRPAAAGRAGGGVRGGALPAQGRSTRPAHRGRRRRRRLSGGRGGTGALRLVRHGDRGGHPLGGGRRGLRGLRRGVGSHPAIPAGRPVPRSRCGAHRPGRGGRLRHVGRSPGHPEVGQRRGIVAERAAHQEDGGPVHPGPRAAGRRGHRGGHVGLQRAAGHEDVAAPAGTRRAAAPRRRHHQRPACLRGRAGALRRAVRGGGAGRPARAARRPSVAGRRLADRIRTRRCRRGLARRRDDRRPESLRQDLCRGRRPPGSIGLRALPRGVRAHRPARRCRLGGHPAVLVVDGQVDVARGGRCARGRRTARPRRACSCARVGPAG